MTGVYTFLTITGQDFFHDILLLYGPGLALGPTQWVRCQISKPRETQLGLGMAFFGPRTTWHWDPLVGPLTDSPMKFPTWPIYVGKTSIFGVETSIILGFLGFSWISLDMSWKF